MRIFKIKNINTPTYWNLHQTATDFGLRQQKYSDIIGKCKSVVELGCGLSPFLSKVNAKEKIGIDFSPKTIESAKELYSDVKYILSDCKKTPLKDKSVNVSVAGEVIEHLEEPYLLLKEMERITKDLIVISTPILEFEDPEHLWQFDEEWFKERGFTTEVVASDRFKGRFYIFSWKKLH